MEILELILAFFGSIVMLLAPYLFLASTDFSPPTGQGGLNDIMPDTESHQKKYKRMVVFAVIAEIIIIAVLLDTWRLVEIF